MSQGHKEETHMIKPSEFKIRQDDRTKYINDIIAEVDARLAKGFLTVDGSRSGWVDRDIQVVADLYRLEGWIVLTGVVTGGKACSFRFELPNE